MKFFILEDKEAVPLTSDTSDIHFYVTPKGQYYYFDGKELKRIPKSILSELIQEQEDSERPKAKETDKEYTARMKEITSDIDGELLDRIEYEEQNRKYHTGDDTADKVRKKETKSLTKLEQLQQDINDFIAMQTGVELGWSHSRPSRYALDPSISLKVRRPRHAKKTPVVNVYFDRSGSWSNPAKTTLGWQAIAMLNDYEQQGLLDVNVYYFAVHVYGGPDGEVHALAEGNNSTDPIIQHMIETQPDNVVIMTDSHMREEGFDDQGWWPVDPEQGKKWYKTHNLWEEPRGIATNIYPTTLQSTYVAPGAVWAIYYGSEPEGLVPKHLRGEEVTKIYKF